MDLDRYQRQAWATDQNPDDPGRALTIALLGLGGEVGTLQTNQKKIVRDGPIHTDYRALAIEDLGDVLWYVADTASLLGVSMAEVATANLKKTAARWPMHERPLPPASDAAVLAGSDLNSKVGTSSLLISPRPARGEGSGRGHGLGPAHVFDGAHPAQMERMPRVLNVQIASAPTSPNSTGPARVVPVRNGFPCGDFVGDNAYDEDGYRFHDALHLGFLAVLGWSPVERALLKFKRKANPQTDDVEDGGRAIAIEEGIAAFIFQAASRSGFYAEARHVESDILRVCQYMTMNLEVAACTTKEWEHAILRGFSIWRELHERGHGAIECDLDARTITVRPLSQMELREHAGVCQAAIARKQVRETDDG
ncbi:nucleoside triphosphate pyrophosphohydrolase family protein [Actinomycetospora atypica]|uniref:MazG C-terminal domain-containing protein n=1 Tax=Actinomycetospora atypica TaxID=1290095 RepID=A0ABV9YGE2_9PSEU